MQHSSEDISRLIDPKYDSEIVFIDASPWPLRADNEGLNSVHWQSYRFQQPPWKGPAEGSASRGPSHVNVQPSERIGTRSSPLYRWKC